MVRVRVDPAGRLSPAELTDGMANLQGLRGDIGVLDNEIAAMPPGRREVELLMAGSEPEELKAEAIALCARAFGTEPEAGVLTYISRGTDDDALGVLAGFGLTGDIERVSGQEGFDVIYVTLRKADLNRIPESRIHTALEASLNCEVHIRTTP